ncbi:MAG: PadR family transcriptional regulator [Acidimicrobiia bacterium]
MLEEFRRGAVRLHILHHACDGEIYGAWMRAELAEHGHQVSPGTLYPMLHAMQEDGLLVSREELAEGRVRRLYRATEGGRDELHACRQALAELAGELLSADPDKDDCLYLSPDNATLTKET